MVIFRRNEINARVCLRDGYISIFPFLIFPKMIYRVQRDDAYIMNKFIKVSLFRVPSNAAR